jgi:hypothetical protein
MVTGDYILARTTWFELEHFVHGMGEIKTTVNKVFPSRHPCKSQQSVLVSH